MKKDFVKNNYKYCRIFAIVLFVIAFLLMFGDQAYEYEAYSIFYYKATFINVFFDPDVGSPVGLIGYICLLVAAVPLVMCWRYGKKEQLNKKKSCYFLCISIVFAVAGIVLISMMPSIFVNKDIDYSCLVDSSNCIYYRLMVWSGMPGCPIAAIVLSGVGIAIDIALGVMDLMNLPSTIALEDSNTTQSPNGDDKSVESNLQKADTTNENQGEADSSNDSNNTSE